MALSNLASIMSSVIGSRKEEIAKTAYDYESKVRNIEKRLDNDGATYRLPAIQALRDLFKYNLSDEDYRKIEREIGYNIK